jgi:hypothetical protein
MRISISRVIWVLWASMIVLVPITTRTSSEGLNGGSFQYRLWTDLLFGIIILIMIARCKIPLLKNSLGIRISKVQFAFLLLFVFNYLSIIVSGLDGHSIMKYIFSGWVWIQALLAYVIAQRMIRTEEEAAWLRRFFIIAFCVVAVIGLLEFLRVPAVINFLDEHYGTGIHVDAAKALADIGEFRLTSTFDRNPHGLALFMMMAITWMTAVLVTESKHPGSKLVPILVICVGIFFLLGAKTATGVSASVVAVLVVMYSRIKISIKQIIALTGLIAVGVYIAQTYLFSTALQKFIDLYSMLSAGEQGPSSYTSRLDIWSLLWQNVKASPIKLFFGISYDEGLQLQNELDITTDSDYMFMLFYGGILGLGVLLSLYWCIHSSIKRSLKVLPAGNPEREALLLAARGIFFGMIIAGFTGGFMTGTGTAWRISFMVYTLIGASLGRHLIRGRA